MRVLVAQPGSAAGEPLLPVGVLRWRRRGPRWTVIVKLTLDFDPPETAGAVVRAKPSADQVGIGAPVPSDAPGARAEDLHLPADFAPAKVGADLLVVGHAFSAEATHRIDVRIAAPGLGRSFALIAGAPAARLPLSRAYLRAADGVSPADPVGPRATPRFEEGTSVGKDFDFSIFASAWPQQRLRALAPDARIELSGLCEGGLAMVLELPGLAPRVVADAGEAGRRPIELACDTLWLDTDRRRVILTWRGQLDLGLIPGRQLEGLLVSLESSSAPREETEVRRELQRGHFAHAVEPGDLPGVPPAPSATDLAIARYSTWESEAPEPRIPLAKYAQISAFLAEQVEPRKAVLLAAGLDEDRWVVEERAWLEKMADDAVHGDGSVAARYGEMFVAAQDGLAPPDEAALGIDDYVELRLAVEEADDPAKSLAQRGRSLASWLRIDRRWSARAAADPALAADLERRLDARRPPAEEEAPDGD